jgi:hypothetical protein
MQPQLGFQTGIEECRNTMQFQDLVRQKQARLREKLRKTRANRLDVPAKSAFDLFKSDPAPARLPFWM